MTKTTETKVALMANDIEYIKNNLDELKEEFKSLQKSLGEKYVTKKEFDPFKNALIGVATLIIVTVIGAILKLVVFPS